jgi:hypothetical protein
MDQEKLLKALLSAVSIAQTLSDPPSEDDLDFIRSDLGVALGLVGAEQERQAIEESDNEYFKSIGVQPKGNG